MAFSQFLLFRVGGKVSSTWSLNIAELHKMSCFHTLVVSFGGLFGSGLVVLSQVTGTRYVINENKKLGTLKLTFEISARWSPQPIAKAKRVGMLIHLTQGKFQDKQGNTIFVARVVAGSALMPPLSGQRSFFRARPDLYRWEGRANGRQVFIGLMPEGDADSGEMRHWIMGMVADKMSYAAFETHYKARPTKADLSDFKHCVLSAKW